MSQFVAGHAFLPKLCSLLGIDPDTSAVTNIVIECPARGVLSATVYRLVKADRGQKLIEELVALQPDKAVHVTVIEESADTP